jgi:hypothetical protein
MFFFIECIPLRDQTNLIAMFLLRDSKNVYPFNYLLRISTCFDHPTGHHQMITILTSVFELQLF